MESKEDMHFTNRLNPTCL